MKKEKTSARLNTLMEERNLRQVDILALTSPFCKKYDVKMNKSDISQYVSGKVEPSQDKLIILGMALNVSESWLMGFDVPRSKSEVNNLSNLSDAELQLLENYRQLNPEGQAKLREYANDLIDTKKYTKSNQDKMANENRLIPADPFAALKKPLPDEDSKEKVSRRVFSYNATK